MGRIPCLLLVLGLAACGGSGPQEAFHEATGVVQEVLAVEAQIVVDHDDIPGLMPAMTMSFDVAKPDLLEHVRPGDRIRFKLGVRDGVYRVHAIAVEGTGPVPDGARLSDGPSALDPAPGFDLVDQDGAAVTLVSLRGKVVFLDFIFTNCPGPCPIQTARHVAVQRAVAAELRPDVHFVSISLDPERDTPEAMKGYARSHGADLDGWSFLTGEPAHVDAVLDAYGVGRIPGADGDIQHTLAAFLIDREGRIATRYLGMDHASADQAEALASLARSG